MEFVDETAFMLESVDENTVPVKFVDENAMCKMQGPCGRKSVQGT